MNWSSLIAKFKEKYDTMGIGLIIGILALALGYSICMYMNGMSVQGVWNAFTDPYRDNFSDIVTVVLLPPMFIFWFFFFILKMNNLPKGLVGVTLLSAGLAFLFSNF